MHMPYILYVTIFCMLIQCNEGVQVCSMGKDQFRPKVYYIPVNVNLYYQVVQWESVSMHLNKTLICNKGHRFNMRMPSVCEFVCGQILFNNPISNCYYKLPFANDMDDNVDWKLIHIWTLCVYLPQNNALFTKQILRRFVLIIPTCPSWHL